jgi:hypothetical protein
LTFCFGSTFEKKKILLTGLPGGRYSLYHIILAFTQEAERCLCTSKTLIFRSIKRLRFKVANVSRKVTLINSSPYKTTLDTTGEKIALIISARNNTTAAEVLIKKTIVYSVGVITPSSLPTHASMHPTT